MKKIETVLKPNEFNTRPTAAEQGSFDFSDHMRHFGTPVRREETDAEHEEIMLETGEQFDEQGDKIEPEPSTETTE